MNNRARGQATAQRGERGWGVGGVESQRKRTVQTRHAGGKKKTTSGGDGSAEGGGGGEMEDSEQRESADGGENNVGMRSQTAIKSGEPLRERDQ